MLSSIRRQSFRARATDSVEARPSAKERAFAMSLLNNKYPALHGLRFIAILLVIVVHQPPWGMPGLFAFLRGRLWFSMDLFFVLSGFLIASLLLSSRGKSERESVAKFYLRRMFRTFPQYYFILGVLFFVSLQPNLRPFLFAPGNQLDYRTHIAKELLYLTNYPFDIRLLMPWSWSLSVEEHFYLICPFFLLFLARLPQKYRLPFLVFVFLIPPVLRFFATNGERDHFFSRVYCATHLRFDPLIAGIFAAVLEKEYGNRIESLLQNSRIKVLAWVVPLVIFVFVICAFSLTEPYSLTNYRIGALCVGFLPAIAYSILILRFIHETGWWTRILGSHAMRVLATLGYNVYLVHYVVINKITPWFSADLTGRVLAFVAICFLSFGYAFIAHYLIDKPFLWLRDRVVPSK